ncbi:hypothetical protein BDW59DRAFT_161469 [Aspergillus cavernicola]|uniref:Uncharacterized protein n=1 Tax=Aspergillus cavernicola TaxID=176166 RepID=A0ABR4IDI2_9EURO
MRSPSSSWGYLSASNVAALHAALKIKPSESVRRHYLHPLRDVDPTMRLFQSWFRDDCQILMIGPDTLLLKERIRNPEAYYQHYRGRNLPQLETWVVGIPPTSKSDHLKRLKRMKRLKRKWNNRRNVKAVRAAALVALEDILDLDTLRQCLCLYDHNKPDSNTLDFYRLVGESVLVKDFDLFDCSGVSSSGLVGLGFLGMQFRLPWNINKAISQGDRWTPKDGMPYIDTAYLFCPQFATADRTCPRGSPRKNFGERDAALLFDCDYSLDERWTASIPTNVFRDGLF